MLVLLPRQPHRRFRGDLAGLSSDVRLAALGPVLARNVLEEERLQDASHQLLAVYVAGNLVWHVPASKRVSEKDGRNCTFEERRWELAGTLAEREKCRNARGWK
ncbi:hypothetical protein NL676_013055 [Syzygium grande]|nr:hypothetical protein NL676_013055 [Syzygium grande]